MFEMINDSVLSDDGDKLGLKLEEMCQTQRYIVCVHVYVEADRVYVLRL